MVQKDLRIDLDDFKRVLCNQTDLVVNEMDEDFRVYDFLTKCIGSDVSYPSDHGSYTICQCLFFTPAIPAAASQAVLREVWVTTEGQEEEGRVIGKQQWSFAGIVSYCRTGKSSHMEKALLRLLKLKFLHFFSFGEQKILDATRMPQEQDSLTWRSRGKQLSSAMVHNRLVVLVPDLPAVAHSLTSTLLLRCPSPTISLLPHYSMLTQHLNQ